MISDARATSTSSLDETVIKLYKALGHSSISLQCVDAVMTEASNSHFTLRNITQNAHRLLFVSLFIIDIEEVYVN